MTTAKNLMFQPLTFHLEGGEDNLHLGPRASRQIPGERVAGAIHGAEVIHAHQTFEDGHIRDVLEARPHGSAGIVHEDIDAAVRRHSLLREGLARGALTWSLTGFILRHVANYRDKEMREFMGVAKALADKNRVRALMALRGRELCVCQIIALLDLAPSTVSKHMAILRQALLVEGRKEGRWIHYRRADEADSPHAAAALTWLDKALARDEVVQADTRKLKSILRRDPEEMCRLQTRA